MPELFSADITREDFLSSGWETVIAQSVQKECHCYFALFLEESNKAEKAQDSKRFLIFRLLGSVTSLLPKLDSPEAPYGPLFVASGSNAPVLADFDGTHIKFLADIVEDINAPELQARVADVVCMRQRDHRYAEIAVAAYLEVATAPESLERWRDTTDPLERAIQIATPYSRNTDYYKSAVKRVEDLLSACDDKTPFYMTLRLMRVLLDRKEGDAKKYAVLAGTIATRAQSENDWEKARQHWELKAEWHGLDKDKQQKRQARIEAAECYVKHADTFLESDSPQNMFAVHWLQRAVKAMRNIEGTRDRVHEVHEKLLECQHKAMSELVPMSSNVDITDIFYMAVKQVHGKSLHDALCIFAALGSPPAFEHMREQAMLSRDTFLLQRYFPNVYHDVRGRVIAKQPQEEEEILQADMWHGSLLSHSLHVQAFINPAHRQIVSEHNIRLEDLVPFVQDSPLIRPGREQIILRGLYAGLHGDMLVAAHLLIPQFEDSLRYTLQQLGVITSDLTESDIQFEDNLNQFLREAKYAEPLTEVFGKDFIFDARGLLIEQFGANLRNNMAHGLISYNEFYTSQAYYFWWVALRFYAWPTAAHLKMQTSERI